MSRNTIRITIGKVNPARVTFACRAGERRVVISGPSMDSIMALLDHIFPGAARAADILRPREARHA